MVARASVRLVTVVVLATHAFLGSARAGHRLSIDVRGPLALVEVERPLVFGAEYGRAPSDEVVVDLDLPDGAVMAGAELRGDGRTLRLQAAAAADASQRYTAATRAATWRSTKAPVDEGVDLRISVSASLLGEADRAAAWTLRYRYAAPLTCREGRLQLTIPGSLDPSPTDAAVDIRVQLGRAGWARPPALEVAGAALRGSGGAVVKAHTSLSQRRAWDLTILGLEPTGPTLGTVLAAGTRTETGEGILAVSLCRASQRVLSPPATRLLVLIDRSRSVGPGNAAQARDLARSLALLLPPSLTFNAVFFDRAAEVLFPLARSATLEALSALDGAVGLGSLRNGTDLPLALRRAVSLAALDREEGLPPAYWVIITDGALPDQDTADALGEAVARVRPDQVETAMLILRGEGDDPVSPDARRALAEVPARLGGVLRELSSGSAVGAATAILNDLRGGGDIVNPVVSATGLSRPSALQPIAVAAGAGGWLLIRTAGTIGSRVTVRGRHAGAAVALSAPVVDLGGGWARALLPRPRPIAWVKTHPVAAALIAPPTALAEGGETSTQRGQMEKDVVRRALGYAFLPRARACYVTRKITSAADFQLKGRLRLELHLERGEMMSASVRRSTLGRPDIESCLREAAFAVDVPRALNSDAPVIAALNLVFRPRTEPRVNDAGVDDDAIKRLLGPMPPPSDPLELLIEDNVVEPGPRR